MSSILVVEPFKTMSFPIKTRVIWVPGMYIHYFDCVYIYKKKYIYIYTYIYTLSGQAVLISGSVLKLANYFRLFGLAGPSSVHLGPTLVGGAGAGHRGKVSHSKMSLKDWDKALRCLPLQIVGRGIGISHI